MMIQLTEAKLGLVGEEDEPLFINASLISTLEDDEFGTWILIPPYQKPIKVRETIKQILKMMGS